MNINPYSITIPHYDSYEDFYKFFEVYPKEEKRAVMPIDVFPPVEPLKIEKKEEPVETKLKLKNKRESSIKQSRLK